MIRAKYNYQYQHGHILILPEPDTVKSLTNDMENIIQDIIDQIGLKRVLKSVICYKDSEGNYDYIKPILNDKRCTDVLFISGPKNKVNYDS